MLFCSTGPHAPQAIRSPKGPRSNDSLPARGLGAARNLDPLVPRLWAPAFLRRSPPSLAVLAWDGQMNRRVASVQLALAESWGMLGAWCSAGARLGTDTSAALRAAISSRTRAAEGDVTMQQEGAMPTIPPRAGGQKRHVASTPVGCAAVRRVMASESRP